MKHILNAAKVGEVWALSLEEGDFGYVRIFRGGCLGVIPVVSNGLVGNTDILERHPARWFFGYAAPPTDSTEMVRIGALHFLSDEEAWPPARYIPPDIFKKYFQIYERGMRRPATEPETLGLQKARLATPDWLRQFILNHRDECAMMEGGVRAEALSVDQGNPESSTPTLLEVVFRNADFPFGARDAVEDPLADALEESGLGEITGGGTGPETCAIDVEVSDVERGLETIRKTLRKLGCPSSTKIHQHQPQHIIHPL